MAELSAPGAQIMQNWCLLHETRMLTVSLALLPLK